MVLQSKGFLTEGRPIRAVDAVLIVVAGIANFASTQL
jgi:hypothetical protein